LSIVLALTFGVSALGAVEIYVAPTGDDANPGTKQKPFATLARARDAVRQQKTESAKEDVTVFLRGGVYRLTETVVFGLADSGGAGQRITYAAFPGETPIICSDVPITGFKKLESDPDQLPKAARGNVWMANVSSLRKLKQKQPLSPTVATQMDRTERFFTLYQGDRRLPRARGKSMSLLKRPSQDTTDDSTFAFPAGAIRNWPAVCRHRDGRFSLQTQLACSEAWHGSAGVD